MGTKSIEEIQDLVNSERWETVSDLADRFVVLLRERLDDLEPVLAEARSIEAMIDHFEEMSRTGEPGDTDLPGGRRMPANTRKQEILDMIQDDPRWKIKDMAAEMGVSPSRVSQLVSQLIAAGTLVRTTDGLELVAGHQPES